MKQAIVHLRAMGDRAGVANALGNLANVLTDLIDYAGERRMLRAAIDIYREHGDPHRLIVPLINLCAVEIAAGDMTTAQTTIALRDERQCLSCATGV